MNDKEKKAIEHLKKEIKDFKKTQESADKELDDRAWFKKIWCELQNDIDIRETVLNLIEKQNIELKNLNSDKEILTDIINKQIKEIDYKDYEMFNIINSDKGKLFEKNKELFEENKELKRQILSLTYTNSIKEK